ncbi:hypothetical protein [Actinomycetospora aeridis]|uniref:Uncharacterized protein n=1 Tax=Actinomycetospora aeridis TaxID=3129231 RepID=A0ABU8N2N1_9PSEU
MTTAERPADPAPPTLTAEAAAAVPAPLRHLLRVRKAWSTPLVFALTAVVGVVTVVSWFEVADRGRPPSWAVVGVIVGSILTLALAIIAFQQIRDVGHEFRVRYAELGADRPRPPAPAVATDEVRVVWGATDRAAVLRGGRPVAALRPDLPVTAPLLARSWKNRAPLVDGEDGRGADAILHADGSHWRLTLAAAEGPDGVAHRSSGGPDDDSGEFVQVDGRRVLEVRSWLVDPDLRWWDLPRPTIEALRAVEDLVWTQVPRSLSDDAVTYLVWRRIARTLLVEARRERSRREQAATSTANNIT